jgi:membrane protein
MIPRLQSSFPVRLLRAFGESKAGRYAAGLAFNAFMTMFPLMLGILSIVGLVTRSAQAQERIRAVLVGAFPGEAQQSIDATLQGVGQHAGLLGLLSLVGLLWTGTGLFASLEFALSEMFGLEQRNFVRQRAMGAAMLIVFVAGLLLAVAANSLAALAVGGLNAVGPLVGTVVMVGLVTVIYRVVPNRSFGLREVLPGALLAGILIEVVTLAFPIYARLVHGFSTYGAAFALFFLLATWLYFVCQFLLLGAVLVRMKVGAPRTEGVVAESDAGLAPTEGARAVERRRHGPEERPQAS